MMMGIIIKDLSKKLANHIDENGGTIFVDAKWVNEWLDKYDSPFIASIVDKDNNEIQGAKIAIKQTSKSE